MLWGSNKQGSEIGVKLLNPIGKNHHYLVARTILSLIKSKKSSVDLCMVYFVTYGWQKVFIIFSKIYRGYLGRVFGIFWWQKSYPSSFSKMLAMCFPSHNIKPPCYRQMIHDDPCIREASPLALFCH